MALDSRMSGISVLSYSYSFFMLIPMGGYTAPQGRHEAKALSGRPVRVVSVSYSPWGETGRKGRKVEKDQEDRIDQLLARVDSIDAAANDPACWDEFTTVSLRLQQRGMPAYLAHNMAYRVIAVERIARTKANAPSDDARDPELLEAIRKSAGKGEPLKSAALAERLKMPQRQVSRALQRLAAAGHVTKKRVGIYQRWCRT